MKRALAIILSVITLALLLVSCNKNTSVPDGMEACTDNTFYTMFMPEGWKRIETGSDATLIQLVTKNGLSNVTANALYWQITAEDIENEEPEARNERLFNAYFDKYKSQLTGEYDQLADGQNKNATLTVDNEKGELSISVYTENGEIKNTYKFTKNGLKLTLSTGAEGTDLNDGYVNVTENEDGTYDITSLYFYGVEYKLVKSSDNTYAGYKKADGIVSEFTVLRAKDLTVKDKAAKEYVYTLKYGDLYYKYYTTVVLGDNFYYVITFTFPERVSERNGEIIKTGEYDDGDYTDEMEKVVTNFIPKK